MASTIYLSIDDSAGNLVFEGEPVSQVGNSSGLGALLTNLAGDSGDPTTFELTLNTQDTLMTFTDSELVVQIAETIAVSGEFVNGSFSVTDVQYSWDSCTTVQDSGFCDSLIGIYGQTATLAYSDAGFLLSTSANVFLVGYSFLTSIVLERQFELTPVPVPAAFWLLLSALATGPVVRAFSSKRKEHSRYCG